MPKKNIEFTWFSSSLGRSVH